jgi:predicted nucleotidyltransferase
VTSELPARVIAAVAGGPGITAVTLAGSRARGEAVELSDWDFAVDTDDFEAAAAALPELVEPLAPLSKQWDRYSPFHTYMLMLAGPVKVDFLFLDRKQAAVPPWQVTRETLGPIDDHFWDWALWLASKSQAGRAELVDDQLRSLFANLLGPLGAERAPATLDEALAGYLRLRALAEARFGVNVPRALESCVRPSLGASV